jgi:hypothetical protein
MAGLDYFTFVADTNPILNFTASPVEQTQPFTRTVASGSDWEVDNVTPYRLKYVGSRLKIFRISTRYQQASSTSITFRPELSMYDFIPVTNGNGAFVIVNGSAANNGAIAFDQYVGGGFFIAVPNTIYAFSLRDRNGGGVVTSTDWILTIFLNILR